MAMDTNIRGAASGNGAEVDTSGNQLVKLPLITAPSSVGAAIMASGIDLGTITGAPLLRSPETDSDFRLRVSHETLLDHETFNYSSGQNTGKHTYANITMTDAWTVSGLQSNSGSSVATTTGVSFGSYGTFPVMGGHILACEMEMAFSNNPVSNTVIDFGLFQRGAANPYAPTDGIYFEMNSGGFYGIINANGTPTQIGPFSAFGTGLILNQKYQFLIVVGLRDVEFWINTGTPTAPEYILQGTMPIPVGLGQPFMSSSLPFSFRHAIVGGAAGAVQQATLASYTVTAIGPQMADSMGTIMQRALGSYQGLSGGVMGGLTKYTNSTNPTAAVPANASLTANLPAGLGGEAWETFTAAVNTDLILIDYTVPSLTANGQIRRLKVTGVKMSAYVQTVLAGGPVNSQFYVAFGATAASLATGEAAATKKPRIVLCPELTQAVTAAQAVSTMVSQPGGCVSMFPEPIYVNPGEHIQLCKKHIGTVGTGGTIAHQIQFIYSWE